jgi:hypothetical protein
MGERSGAYRGLVGNQREGDHLEVRGVDVKIILKRIFKKCDGSMNWIDYLG